jgi:TPR repeat protein
MISAHSPWLAAHGRLWYDDKWYRYGWIVWPQALAALLVLWFWLGPTTSKSAQWGVPVDSNAHAQALTALRDTAKSDQQAMNRLEAEARGGEMVAQFYMGTLYDPDLKMSKIVTPGFDQAADWYSRAAAQGHQVALSNLALAYSNGKFTRVDYSRACYYALKLLPSAPGNGLNVKGDCYARGLGGTRTDPTLADAAYKAATANGATRAAPPQQPAQLVPSLPPSVPAVAPPPSLDPVPFKPQPPPLNPPPLQPRDNSDDTQWGAMAFTLDGSYSTVWRMHSQPEAEASVAKQCSAFGRGACKVFSISGQECASLATYVGRRYESSYTAGGATYPEAQNNALERCNSDGRNRGRCKTRNTFCADGR